MTDKEKAQAFDEALERFHQFKEKYYRKETHFGDVLFDKTGEMQKDFDSIFPQLAESEDERIRKRLLWFLANYTGRWDYPETRMACRAWLEKQKEQKPVQTDDEKKYIRTIKSIITDFIRDKKPEDVAYYQRIYDWLDGRHIEQKPAEVDESTKRLNENWMKQYFDEQKPVDYEAELKKCKDNPLYFFDKYVSIKQKPAEWSKNDTVFLNEITDFFENKTVKLQHDIDMYAHWLKYLPERFNLEPKQEWNTHDKAMVNCIVCCLDGQFVPEAARKQSLEWFNKHRRDFLNQPKQEWSEEDEKMLELVIANYEYMFDKLRKGDDSDGIPDHILIMDWLKSLPMRCPKSSDSWKPSEEQMSALLAVLNDPNNIGSETCQLALTGLYEQLKKTM